MATDSTELTFVRCPHCRSLVPAMSKVCRMCGEPLDAAAKVEEPDRRSGRIRQRTMSRPNEELSSTANKIREEMGVSPTELMATEGAAGGAAEIEDPLGAYIEEVTEGSMNEPAATPVGLAGEPVHEPAVPAEEPVEAAPIPNEPVEIEEPKAEERERPRVIVESGARRQGKSGLSFGRRDDSRSHDEPAKEARREIPAPEQRHDHERRHENRQKQGGFNASPQHGNRPHEGRDTRHENRPPEARREEGRAQEHRPQQSPPRREERREDRREDRREVRHEEQESNASQPATVAHAAEPQKRENVNGRLIGWLVSYADPDGAATELREGKFFVTSNSLKQTDLIITDPSVSTPHALVTIASEQGLRVQDLMSERGVFIRPRNGDTYQRINEMSEVHHGDWVRFGDVEFLVSLIAHIGER